MPKFFHSYFIIGVVFIFLSIFTTNSYAQVIDGLSKLEEQLGVYTGVEYSNVSISEIPVGKVIGATVVDPSKMGGCLKGDLIELTNLGNGEWTVSRLADGRSFQVAVQEEYGVLTVKRTRPFGQSVTPSSNIEKTAPFYNMGLGGRTGFGVRGSYVKFYDDNYVLNGIQVDVEADDAPGLGINFTHFFHNNFSIEVSADYIKTDVELSALGLSGDAGELTLIPVFINLRLHADMGNNVSPYFVAAVGYFFNEIDTNRNTAQFLYGPGAEFDIDNCFAFGIGAGIEIFLLENAALNLDIKYIWAEAEASVNKPGFENVDIEFNPLIVGLGFKFYF